MIGYDPFNEPFSPGILLHTGQNAAFDAQVQCFYAGGAHPGETQSGQRITDCPPDDPEIGVIPTHRARRSPPRRLLRTRHDHQRSGPEPYRADGFPPPRLQLPRLLSPARAERARGARLLAGLPAGGGAGVRGVVLGTARTMPHRRSQMGLAGS